jgi:diguanylate cyclase (GGDEF)-like protein
MLGAGENPEHKPAPLIVRGLADTSAADTTIGSLKNLGSLEAEKSLTDERRFRSYSFAVFAIGLLAATALSLWLPFNGSPQLWWIGPALAVAFFLAEQIGVSVDVRSGLSWTISFTEIPLVIGFFVAPFEIVLAAHLLAGVITLAMRGVASRILYNAGAFLLEITGAFALAALVQHALGHSQLTWGTVLLGTLMVPLLSTLLALLAVWVFRRRMRIDTALKLTTRIMVVGFVNASFGLCGYLLISQNPQIWPLMLAVAFGLAALYWAYSGLLREHRDMEALTDVGSMVSRLGRQRDARWEECSENLLSEGETVEWNAIATRMKDQLSADRVVLRLRLGSGEALHTVVAGEPLPPAAMDAEPFRQLTGISVRHFRVAESSAEIKRALVVRHSQEVLIAPLVAARRQLGFIEVHDRLSRWRGFGKYDLQLLGLMASNIATSLDNRRLMGTLRHDAYHDPTTGLLNRLGFRRTAQAPSRDHDDAVVMRVDLDVYSTVSDALGYTWADRIVAVVGERLQAALGKEVPLARLEGTSFAALLVDCPMDQAQETAERLRRELSAPYPIDKLAVESTVAVGYASSAIEDVPEASDIDGLLQRADVALRAARGAEEVRAYVPSMGQIFLRRFQLVTQFRRALQTQQLSVHYQPKISLPSRQVLGVESLVRWQHPEFGKLNPDEFVPAVEAAGLVDALTDFVLDESLRRIRKWLDDGVRIGAAVNLSVRVLSDTQFPSKVAEQLKKFDIPAELLTLELTESGVMSDPQRALPVLRELHALGIVLAVDDFGTGYSSLAYLRQLPVDEVKIDKSFVLGMGTDLGDLAVVRSIVELGHSLGLAVVAEGVEEDIARDQLEAMGCDVAQGYLISRPLPEDRLEAWLQARTVRSSSTPSESVLTLLT